MDKPTSKLFPKLAEGIEFNLLGQDEYILSNSRCQHYLKVNKETYNLLSLINGERDINTLSDTYNNLYNKNISTESIEKLLYVKLLHFGILKGFENEIKPYKKPSYLKLSFIVINEHILSKIVPHFYFLFKRKWAILLIVTSLTILGTLLFLNINLYRSFSLQGSMIYFFVIMTISLIFHEIGHATSTSYFGAKLGGIGVGFYLISPVYYTDVTDIWRLKKRQRIIVNLSGIYFELLFCSLLAIVGYFINNYVFMIITIAVFIRTLLNLNPFIRNDGYWILSDLMEKPNLNYHSARKVKDLFRIFVGKKTSWKKIDIVLLIYGLMNMVVISFFLYYVTIKNPNSILLYPQNLINFVKNIFDSTSEISLIKFGELVIPTLFFLLLFGLIKSIFTKILKKVH